jgi:hypothetical protein
LGKDLIKEAVADALDESDQGRLSKELGSGASRALWALLAASPAGGVVETWLPPTRDTAYLVDGLRAAGLDPTRGPRGVLRRPARGCSRARSRARREGRAAPRPPWSGRGDGVARVGRARGIPGGSWAGVAGRHLPVGDRRAGMPPRPRHPSRRHPKLGRGIPPLSDDGGIPRPGRGSGRGWRGIPARSGRMGGCTRRTHQGACIYTPSDGTPERLAPVSPCSRYEAGDHYRGRQDSPQADGQDPHPVLPCRRHGFSRTKRDGRAIEEIGKYHPTEEPSVIDIDSARAAYWLAQVRSAHRGRRGAAQGDR